MNCLNCKKEFTPKRATARFCSPRCRVYFNRTPRVEAELKESISKLPKVPARLTTLEGHKDAKSLIEARWNDLCPHLAAKGMCKKSKCPHSMFNPKNK